MILFVNYLLLNFIFWFPSWLIIVIVSELFAVFPLLQEYGIVEQIGSLSEMGLSALKGLADSVPKYRSWIMMLYIIETNLIIYLV